ncbi:uncharacterized protein PAC_19751 [Phialocephala subalpina]|uniref:Zn(2)-C6 fungal-type domain-containing protein n=1 Tax=Phialocephala subalpina TaxID=576137 RepID=A0A1L7XXQ3_9HELO|nr:uncharacterized protein PAC_19751 [Phialocephala subalpina]
MSASTTPYAFVPILDDPAPAAPKPSHEASSFEGLGSCVHCRRRKVRCDKKIPCDNCVRLGFKCELAPRKRAPRRPRKETHGESEREVELVQRLNTLEGMVKKLGGQLKTDTSLQDMDAGLSDIAKNTSLKHGSVAKHNEDKLEKDFGILMLNDEGQSRYVSRNFFARLNEEVDDIRKLVYEDPQEHEESESPETHSSAVDDDHQGYVFGYSSSGLNLRDLHPLPSQLPFYLKMYAQKIDPVVKMFHIPSMEKLVEEAQGNLDNLSRSKEALLFIFLGISQVGMGILTLRVFSVSCMSPLEVKSNFRFERTEAIERYRFGLEQALARAGFLDTSDPMTLQAFILYLTVVRVIEDNRKGWTLVRAAIGIGQSLGLHRDGTAFDLPPFEVEMRRRIWWQLFILDFRMAEKHGTEPSISENSFDTKRPLNINDADISPEDTAFPEPRVGLTEMTCTLIGTEIAFAAPNLLKSPKEDGISVEEKEERINQYQQLLEDRYIKHANELTPVAWVASILPRLVIAKMKTIFLLPYTRSFSKDAKSKEMSDKMFVTSIEVVELRRMLEAETTKQWHWYLGTIIQWHSIAYLLSELCVREPDDNVARAWNVLDQVFKDWRSLQQHGAPAILMTPMKKLIARARHKRAQDLEAARTAEATKLRTPGVMAQSNSYFDNMNQQFLAPTSLIDPADGSTAGSTSTDVFPHTTAAGYPNSDQWIEQQVTNNIPTPWLLEETALQDLGFNPTEIGPDMDWELNNWMQDFTPSHSAYAYQSLGGL